MKAKDILIVVLLVATLGVSLAAFFNGPKIAFVRSADLIEGYAAVPELDRKSKQVSEKWATGIDSLQKQFGRELARYHADSALLAKDEKQLREMGLYRLQQQAMNYQKTAEEEISANNQQLTDGMLNQINAFIKEYGTEHRYTVILGTNESGTLLYATDAVDITEELLTALNNNYKGV